MIPAFLIVCFLLKRKKQAIIVSEWEEKRKQIEEWKAIKSFSRNFLVFVLPSSSMTFQSQSLKISLNWKQRTCWRSEFNQAQHYCETWHKNNCFWLTWFKATAKPTGYLWGASQASTAETKVFLITKTSHGNQVIGPSNNKGSRASPGLTIFTGIIPIINFLLYRSVNTLHFSVLKGEHWANSTPANQKRVCQP